MVWTADEEQILLNGVAMHTPWKSIAAQLERTVSGCRCKYQRLAGEPPPRRYTKGVWNRADTKRLAQECERGLDWARISRAMQRSEKACQDRWRRIQSCRDISPEEASVLLNLGWIECAKRFPSRSIAAWKVAHILL